jgi:hypothetical protein
MSVDKFKKIIQTVWYGHVLFYGKNDKSPTCNAPIPAFPRAHIDGADASALAKARLEVYMQTWTKNEYKQGS